MTAVVTTDDEIEREAAERSGKHYDPLLGQWVALTRDQLLFALLDDMDHLAMLALVADAVKFRASEMGAEPVYNAVALKRRKPLPDQWRRGNELSAAVERIRGELDYWASTYQYLCESLIKKHPELNDS